MSCSRFGSLAAIATTPQGAQLLIPLCQSVNQEQTQHQPAQHQLAQHQPIQQMVVWVPPSVAAKLPPSEWIKCYDGSLKDHLASLWSDHQGFIFCLAMGAVVRLFAPLLQDKQQDPAVVVVDENGRHAISACSGHQGQADDLACWVATQLEAEPVLTGASNRDRRMGIDILGRPFGWRKGPGDWTGISAAIARQETVHVIQDAGTRLWQHHLPKEHTYHIQNASSSECAPFTTHPPSPTLWISPVIKAEIKAEGRRQKAEGEQRGRGAEGQRGRGAEEQGGRGAEGQRGRGAEGQRGRGAEEQGSRGSLLQNPKSKIQNPKSSQERNRTLQNPKSKIQNPKSKIPQAQWFPRVLWIGVGCERHTSRLVIETAIQQTLAQYRLAAEAIAGIATIDLKADEIGLLELCGDRHWPLQRFTADQLKAIDVPNPSSIVNQAVGTPSVAEAAALLAASTVCSTVLSTVCSTDLVAFGSAEGSTPPLLLAPKQIYRLQDQPGAVTVAIAQAPVEYVGHPGQLALVGMGPGQLDQMTPAAKGAVVSADAVIGYGLYLELIRPLLRPGQIVESLPITQERQRAERAIALAQWGLSVAVVSSGDCGIYGMAGLVMEQLQRQGWDGQTPSLQVFPGVTALQAAAARVGSPLMHDFCAISLSDLLTPWEVIEQRLAAAAQADFVTALYNPKSNTRVKQIAIAHAIFLKYRNPGSPVALVRSAYRTDEKITLTTLEKLLDSPIDMMTLVLIGNSSTRQLEQWLITPRGYLPKDS